LSLRQVNEMDAVKEEPTPEAIAAEEAKQAPLETPSLESLPVHQDHAPRRDRRERGERGLLSGLKNDEGELTAMAEAFRAAARQRTKEETEGSE